MSPEVSAARELIERRGLVLLQDRVLPSLVGLIAGGPVAGSWWSHPKGDVIYRVAEELGTRRDVWLVKLVDGKLTFVHRRHFPALVAIGRSREPWQVRGLDPAARRLLAEVDRKGTGVTAAGKAVKALEAVLLAVTAREHGESGAHRTVLSTWEHLARTAAVDLNECPPPAAARAELEGVLAALSREVKVRATLPWAGRVRP